MTPRAPDCYCPTMPFVRLLLAALLVPVSGLAAITPAPRTVNDSGR